LLWRANLGAQTNISAPSVASGTVYVGGTGLFALNATTGHRRWVRHTVGVNVSTPAIAYRKVFVNSQDPDFGLWAFNAITGAFLWRREAPEESEATVTVANHVVYDIAENGKLMMFKTSTGAILGTIVDPHGHRFNSLFGAQPAVLNGKVYIPAENRIDAFRLPRAQTFAYVANFRSNTVSVIDTASNTVTATVRVGTNPFAVAITPDGIRAYVTNFGDNTVSVIDTPSNTVTATVSVGTNPLGVAINP
jgi:YVTN family beta-propeller protein